MVQYLLESRKMDGTYLDTLPFRNLQGEFFRSRPKQIRWDMPNNGVNSNYTQFYPGKTEVWLWRDGVKVFVGPLWDVTASSGDNKLTCMAESIESYLWQRRISNTNRYQQTFGSLAWNLISNTQALANGDLLITQGSIVPAGSAGGTITYKAQEGIIVGDAITDLGDMFSGFDWEIDVNRVFNEYWPRTSRGPARVNLDWGGNILSYAVQYMGKYEANDVLIKGVDKVYATAGDAAKRAEYGLRQYVGSSNLKSYTALTNYTQQVQKKRRTIRIVPQVTVRPDLCNPFLGDITYGQTATLTVSDGWVQFSEVMKMDGFQVTVGKQGNESFTLYLNDLRED